MSNDGRVIPCDIHGNVETYASFEPDEEMIEELNRDETELNDYEEHIIEIATQAIREVLEYGRSQGKTSIEDEDIAYHLRHAHAHSVDWRNGVDGEPHLKHALTRHAIAYVKEYDAES